MRKSVTPRFATCVLILYSSTHNIITVTAKYGYPHLPLASWASTHDSKHHSSNCHKWEPQIWHLCVDSTLLSPYCETVTSCTIITVTIDTLLKISSPLELAALTLGAKQIAFGFWNRSLLLLQHFRLYMVREQGYKTIEKGGSNQNKNNPNTKIEVDLRWTEEEQSFD